MAKRKTKKQVKEVQPEEPRVETTRVAPNDSTVRLSEPTIQETEVTEKGGLEILRGKNLNRRFRLR